MTDTPPVGRGGDEAASRLCQSEPEFYELEPGGALGLPLATEGWMLEITPDGRIICQTGVDMDDIKSLLSDGTPEDLGTDELAKQAKYFLQPAVAKFRATLVRAGFEETTEMTEEYVAGTVYPTVDFQKLNEVTQAIRWCQQQFKGR